MSKENYKLPTDVWNIIGQYLPKRSDYYIYKDGFVKRSEIVQCSVSNINPKDVTIILSNDKELNLTFQNPFKNGKHVFEHIMLD